MQDQPNKAALRRTLLAQRQRLAPEVRKNADVRIIASAFAWWSAARPACLGVYWPMREEPDLRGLYALLAQEGVRLALPLVVRKDAPLVFAPWKPGDALIKDSLGVWVPESGVAEVQPDALLIPCVGFNSRNQRLGYGGGYYDRTLALRGRPEAIGVAYECCRCEFEGDAYDIALDRVITEAG